MMSRGTISRSSRGFTLIELMLAIAILALIMTMLASSFHAVAMSKLHAEDVMYTERAGRTILWQLANEIHGAVQTPDAPSRVLFLGVGKYIGGAPLNTVTVSTLNAGHRRSLSGFGPEDVVSYTVVPNTNHRGWYLLERSQQSALAYGAAAPTPIPITDNLLAMRIRYYDGTQWGDVWNSETMTPGTQIPVAVAIDMVLAAPNGKQMRFSTQVDVPMSMSQW